MGRILGMYREIWEKKNTSIDYPQRNQHYCSIYCKMCKIGIKIEEKNLIHNLDI